MGKKVIFSIPTLFNREDMVKKAVKTLENQCKQSKLISDYKIVVVCNTPEKEFMDWKIESKKVIKMVSGELHNVPKALNLVISEITDEDYYCFIQDDMLVYENDWIDKFIKIYERKELKCGVLGVRPHSTAKKYRNVIEDGIDEVLWTDGIMFMSTLLLDKVTGFDETLIGDCESQDLCYRINSCGYKNYWIKLNQDHFMGGFGKGGKKVNENQYQKFSESVSKAREVFMGRWAEWENKKIKGGMRNVVFLPNINLGDGRSNPYKFSIKSWKYWCNKNDCDLVVFDTPICDVKDMKITWQRYYAMEILDNSEINYDQVLMVDADTVVHPNCPNFFEMTEHKFTAVHNDGSYDWVLRSMENYHKHLFYDTEIPFNFWEYINTGFLIFNSRHKQFLKEFLNFYDEHKDLIINLQETYHVGTCQPVMNFFLRLKNIETKLLPYEFNMVDLSRKEILNNEFTMTKMGWIYHYNAIPQEFQKSYGTVSDWMERTYKYLYD